VIGAGDEPVLGPVLWPEVEFDPSEKLCSPTPEPDSLEGTVVIIKHGGCDYCTKATNAVNGGAVCVVIHKPGDGELKFNNNSVEDCLNSSAIPVLFMRIDDVKLIQDNDVNYARESNERILQLSECASGELCNFLHCGPGNPCACIGESCAGGVVCPDLVPCPKTMNGYIGQSSELFVTNWEAFDQVSPKAKSALGLALAVVAVVAIFAGGKALIRLRTRRSRTNIYPEEQELAVASYIVESFIEKTPVEEVLVGGMSI